MEHSAIAFLVFSLSASFHSCWFIMADDIVIFYYSFSYNFLALYVLELKMCNMCLRVNSLFSIFNKNRATLDIHFYFDNIETLITKLYDEDKFNFPIAIVLFVSSNIPIYSYQLRVFLST